MVIVRQIYEVKKIQDIDCKYILQNLQKIIWTTIKVQIHFSRIKLLLLLRLSITFRTKCEQYRQKSQAKITFSLISDVRFL